jgi:6-phosphogluconate dehydrogenase
MFIFDFGLSKSIKNVDNDIKYTDYYMILQAFISKKRGLGWIEDDMDINVNINMISIRNALINIYSKIYTDKFFDMFGRIIEDIFKKFKTNTGIFTTAKPANILNKIPFIINKVKEYPNIDFRKEY